MACQEKSLVFLKYFLKMNKITFGNNVKRIRESDLGLSANKAAQKVPDTRQVGKK